MLAGLQVLKGRFPLAVCGIGLSVDTAQLGAEVVLYDVDRVIG